MPTSPPTLMLLNRLPFPLDDGWRVRTFHVVRALARRGPVTVLAFGNESPGIVERFRTEAGPGVTVRLVMPPSRYGTSQLLRGLLGPLPIYVVNELSPAFTSALRQAMHDVSPMLVVCGLMAMYEQVRVAGCDVTVVVDTHNIDSLLMQRYARSEGPFLRRWYAAVTAGKLVRYEDRVLSEADAVIVCSEIERRQFLARVPSARVWVVPNGASVEEFRRHATPPVHGRVLFFGRLDYRPNVDALAFFVSEILPVLRRRAPHVEFHVAGTGADPELSGLLSRAAATVFHGRVEDLAGLVQSAHVVVVPLRLGGGTRLKILEAMAAGRPVVSTSIGAEGLEVSDGRNIVVRDAPETFAAAVADLVEHPQKAVAIGEAGRRLIAAGYDWDSSGAKLLDMLMTLPSAGRPCKPPLSRPTTLPGTPQDDSTIL